MTVVVGAGRHQDGVAIGIETLNLMMSWLCSHSRKQPVPLDGLSLPHGGRPWPPCPRRLTLVGLCTALGLLAGCSDTWPFSLLVQAPVSTSERIKITEVKEPVKASGPLIRKAQTLLARLGYAPGPADGIDGPKTRAAVSNYQADNGLEINEKVSPGLVEQLASDLRDGGKVAATPRLMTDSLPGYELGDSFVYSDGRAETVIGVDGDKVRWQSNSGTIFTASRDFVRPWASWVSADQRGQTMLSAERGGLWPLKPGKKTSFSAKSIVQIRGRPENISEALEKWACRVGKQERITVVAGTFNTIKVVCHRAARDSAPQLTRVWYYAPRVRHYVRLNDFYDVEEQDRHVELVAIQPGARGWPPAARAGLDWALQHALENMSGEERIEWSSSAVETRVTIRPRLLFERGDGKTCRNFVQVWADKRTRHSYPGTACREAQGRWQVPGLSDGPGKARALLGTRF